MTNFEKIKNMSSKEFAEKYASYMCGIEYCEYDKEKVCPCYDLCEKIQVNEFIGCKGTFAEWLENEVEE